MKIASLALVLACAAVAAPAGAATPPPTKTVRPVRVVLASAKLPSVVETPMHFKLLSVEVPAGQSAGYERPNGFIFLLSGSL